MAQWLLRTLFQTEKIVVEIPSSLAQELATVNQQVLADILQRGLRDLHIDLALEHYKRGNMSFAAAAEQAGVSQAELARAAYVRGIEPPYDETMIAETLA
jgi:predicted HTH domain antitoxin